MSRRHRISAVLQLCLFSLEWIIVRAFVLKQPFHRHSEILFFTDCCRWFITVWTCQVSQCIRSRKSGPMQRRPMQWSIIIHTQGIKWVWFWYFSIWVCDIKYKTDSIVDCTMKHFYQDYMIHIQKQ